MFGLGFQKAGSARAVLEALSDSVAIVEFDPTGKVLSANAAFCKTMGYEAPEIVGRHHSILVDPVYGQSPAYREFWTRLGAGQSDAREYKLIAKGGRKVWVQGNYNPVKDSRGQVIKVVKIATDVTSVKLRASEFESNMTALSRVQAIIEFTPTGEILAANENFLKTMGYRLEEIVGRPHRMFVEPSYAASVTDVFRPRP